MGQENAIYSPVSAEKQKKIIFNIILGLFVFLHFLLNFIGSPYLLYLYILEVIFCYLSVVSLPWKSAIIPVIFLSFIEGQGKILLNHHILSKLILDGVLVIAVLKNLAKDFRLNDRKNLPGFYYMCIGMHFFWYIVQFVNPKNLGLVAVLVSTKIYIFPFILFLFFLKEDIGKEEGVIERISAFVIIMAIFENLLCTFQMQERESLLLSISSNYKVTLNNVFIGEAFRPYGTSNLPGGFSSLIICIVPLFFLLPLRRLKNLIIHITVQVTGIFNLYIMQVRANLIKFILIGLFAYFITFLRNTQKFKSFLIGVFLFLGLIIFLFIGPPLDELFPGIDFTYSLGRFELLANTDVALAQRAGVGFVLNSIWERLYTNPIGLGPGWTGAAAAISSAKIAADPVYGANFAWAFDNLYVAIITEFGFGGIFYLLIVLTLPITLGFYAIRCLMRNDPQSFKIIGLCALMGFIFQIGNWAAISNPYYPESFWFWFWAALGFNRFARHREKNQHINH